MHTLAVSGFLLVLATLFAIFEIEAEGKYGWGEKFPTWYRTTGFVAKLYGSITHKPLTGYHAALFFVPFFLFMWPMVATATMTWAGVFSALSNYFAWVVLWDFIWFVLNPNYGIKQFRRTSVWWFSREPWLFGRIPFGYVSSWATALGLSAVSGVISGSWQTMVNNQLQQFGWYLAGLVLLVAIGAPLYGKYYRAMRRTDERADAGIFH